MIKLVVDGYRPNTNITLFELLASCISYLQVQVMLGKLWKASMSLAEMHKKWCNLLFPLFNDPNQHLSADFVTGHSLEVALLPMPLTTAVMQAVNSSLC